MNWKFKYIWISVFIFFAIVGCSTTRSVSSGLGLQKRKYNKGWFLSRKKQIRKTRKSVKNQKQHQIFSNKTPLQSDKGNRDTVLNLNIKQERLKVVSEEIVEGTVFAIEKKESIAVERGTVVPFRNNKEEIKTEEHSKFYNFWLSIGLFITNIGYFWALKSPEDAFRKGSRKRKYLVGVLITWCVLSLLLSLMSGAPFLSSSFIIWPLFLILFRDKVRKLFGNKKNKKWAWALFTTFFLIVSEIGVAIELERNILLHLLTFLGFYIGLGVVVLIFYKKDRFNFSELFLAGGLMGVFIEQAFAGPLMLIGGNVGGFLIFAWWVFPVYGFYLATTYLMFYEENSSDEGKIKQQEKSIKKTLLVLFSSPVIILIVGTIISKILTFLGVPLYE